LNPRVEKRMRMTSHNMKKAIRAYAQLATLASKTIDIETWTAD